MEGRELLTTSFKRYWRQADPQGPEDVPFDPARHGLLSDYEHRGVKNYSVIDLYKRLEEGLLADNFALLRSALEIRPDFSIDNVRITQIQQENQECIFRLDITIAGQNFVLVAGISRHSVLNQKIKESHDNIVFARNAEAHELNQFPWSGGYSRVATYPIHFGDYNVGDGPYFYLAEFLEGFYGVNCFYRRDPSRADRVARHIGFNGFNQGKKNEYLDSESSELILADIAGHQLETAVRCKQVLLIGLRSGDYLANLDEQRLMLHCFRKDAQGYSGFWIKAMEMIESDADPLAEIVAYQLLSMLAFREDNLVHDLAYGFEKDKEFFVYSFENMMGAVLGLIDSSVLNECQWKQVYQLMMAGLISVTPMFEAHPLPDDLDQFETRMMLKRIADLATFIRLNFESGRR